MRLFKGDIILGELFRFHPSYVLRLPVGPYFHLLFQKHYRLSPKKFFTLYFRKYFSIVLLLCSFRSFGGWGFNIILGELSRSFLIVKKNVLFFVKPRPIRYQRTRSNNKTNQKTLNNEWYLFGLYLGFDRRSITQRKNISKSGIKGADKPKGIMKPKNAQQGKKKQSVVRSRDKKKSVWD